MAATDELLDMRDQFEAALACVKLLEGIISICMYCKKIKDDQNSWHHLETYITEHSETLFSHGMCPQCFEEQTKLIKIWLTGPD